jgi:hypothetical protein
VDFPGAFSMGQEATIIGMPIVKMVKNPAKASEMVPLCRGFFSKLLIISSIYE